MIILIFMSFLMNGVVFGAVTNRFEYIPTINRTALLKLFDLPIMKLDGSR